jgi:uncharacterized protein YqeY
VFTTTVAAVPAVAAAMFSLRTSALLLRAGARFNSTSAAAPVIPLLGTLRNDLKTAMRAKNTLQLSVLRSLLAEITNAQKTSSPPTDDLGILAIINKTRAKSQVSIDEAVAAGREDLAEKEKAQLEVLSLYADMVKTVGRDEIREVVERVVGELGAGVKMGEVIKVVSKELEGRPVVRAEVAGVVKEVLSAAK